MRQLRWWLALSLAMGSSLMATPLPGLGESNLAEVLKQHQGKIVVLNFWATWCGPCREEFPFLVRLHQDDGSRGLTVIAVSMDEPEDAAVAAAFLREQKAPFPSFIRAFEDFTRFVDLVDPGWSGALPATFVFDRNGKLEKSLVGAVTWEDLRRTVDPLLAKSD